MNTPGYQAIDPAVLMGAAGDRANFNALSQTFLDHAPSLHAALRLALAEGRQDAAGGHSHALKGMTVLVGAAELTTLLQQIETAARLGRPAPAAAATLDACFARVLAEVARSMGDASAGGA